MDSGIKSAIISLSGALFGAIIAAGVGTITAYTTYVTADRHEAAQAERDARAATS
jgi:hypothetical protein